jgi:hypothetical protein
VYVARRDDAALRTIAGFDAAIEWISETSRAVETPRELAADTVRWLMALLDADSGIRWAGKVMAATNPSRVGAAAISIHLERRNCAGFLPLLAKGLLFAKFALSRKAGGVPARLPAPDAFRAPEITGL